MHTNKALSCTLYCDTWEIFWLDEHFPRQSFLSNNYNSVI